MQKLYKHDGAATSSAMLALAIGIGVIVPGGAQAQEFPTRPVSLVVPFAPGSSFDAGARLVAEEMSKQLGERAIVENRTGAAGSIGYNYVAKSEKDGHTVLVGYSTTTTCSHALNSNVTWEIADLEPIGIYATQPLVAVIPASLGLKSVADFVSYAKSRPDGVSYGSSGNGSHSHLTAINFSIATGTDLTHVPYKGIGEVIPDLVSERLQLSFPGPGDIKQHVLAGSVTALAVASDQRSPLLPDVPTMQEAGVDGMNTEGWTGLFVPAGTPPEVIEKLSGTLRDVVQNDEFKEKALNAGLVIRYFGRDEMKARIETETAECVDLVKSARIELN